MTEKNLNDKANEAYEFVQELKEGRIKSRELKIPRKAKVRRSKIKKGWVGILKVDENGNISGEKQKVSDSTIRLKKGTYHATDGRERLYWDGKFPVIIQPTWRLNPLDLRKEAGEKNETYGQPYEMAKMLGDAIKVKAKQIGSWLIIVLLGVGGIILYNVLTKH